MSRAGQLRDRVALTRKTRTSDGAGGWAVDWSAVGTFWTEARPVTGNVRFMADGLRENETVMFEFRGGADIRQGDRLEWQGAQYVVQAVSPLDAKRRFIEVRGQAIQSGEAWAA